MPRINLNRSLLAILVSLLLSVSTVPGSAQNAPMNDAILVLPFENTSTKPEYNWIGESFADALSYLLAVPGVTVVPNEERELAYQRLQLPLTTLPSRATSIKLAREVRATMLVIGTYSVTVTPDGKGAAVSGSARVIKVNEGRLMGEQAGGTWMTREYDFGGPLSDIQEMQGVLAYQVLLQRDRALAFPRNEFVERAKKVPQRAFEAYVKGIQTSEKDPTRAIYLKNALRLFAEAFGGQVYPQAAFELGHYYMKQNNWKDAALYFSMLQKKDSHYPEAAFYAALAYWKLGDLERSLGSIAPLAADMPLTGIYNNAGAISVQASVVEKKEQERRRLLSQALNYLRRAAESSPDDPMVQFNYGYALFIDGKFAEAAEQLRRVIAADPRDGQAYFLLAKSLDRSGVVEQATSADNEARKYLQAYAKWQTEWQRSQTASEVPIRLRQAFNRSDYFGVMRDRHEVSIASGDTQDLLAKARELYVAGQDDDALLELRRVLMVEPMNAEAYLLIGRINLRRGDQEGAISVLKTAIFWDAKLIDAHVLLGRVFLERGDRAQAMSYARSAIQIDQNNQEALALMRQVETGGK